MALTAEQRRRNAQVVIDGVERLAQVETALLDAEARLPALRREVSSIRSDIAAALAPATEPETEDARA